MLETLELPTSEQMRVKICNVQVDTDISFCLCVFIYLMKAIHYMWVEYVD